MIFVPLGAPDATPAARLERIIANMEAAEAELRALSRETAKDYALLAIGPSEGIGAVGLRARSAPRESGYPERNASRRPRESDATVRERLYSRIAVNCRGIA